MKRSILLRLFVCLALAGIAFLWSNALMDSLYAYRSPLQFNPPQPGEPLLAGETQPATRRVIFVLIDALRLDTSLDEQTMPFLTSLRQSGAWATMHSRPPSYSSPGYSVLLIGAWPAINDGPALNLEYEEIPTWTQDNLFSAAHRAGLKTAISANYWFEKLIPQQDVDAAFYTPGEDQIADRQVVDAALPWLKSPDYQFVMIHLDQVDYAGHYQGGAVGPGWQAAAERSDLLLQEIAGYLDFSQDTLLVLSDHGQIDGGGHGGQDAITLVEPFILTGAGVKPGQYPDIQMVDVSPTVAALLGANIPASSQGRVLNEMLVLSPTVSAALPAALAAQQDRLVTTY